MKKFLACACVGLLLVGCGGSKEKVTKTCNAEVKGGNIEMKINAEGSTITDATFHVVMPFEELGVTADQAKELFTEDQLQLLETTMLTNMDVSKEDVKPTTKLSDTGIEMDMSMEVGKMEKMLGGAKLDDSIKELETQGYTCK